MKYRLDLRDAVAILLKITVLTLTLNLTKVVVRIEFLLGLPSRSKFLGVLFHCRQLERMHRLLILGLAIYF